jgi:phospholipid-binding lipoprotein MlaA
MARATTRTCLVALLCAAALASACAPPGARGARASFRPDYDPLEPLNRKVFWFNDQVDVHLLEPAARGWDWIVPDRVQRSVSNFFVNLRFPIVTVNDLLQAKVRNGASDVGRFAVNTTVGVLGLFDPATSWGLEQHVEDFGQTLGWWGVAPGPYLVLPFIGPSNPRDTVGLAADSAASVTSFFVDGFILAGAKVVETVNFRSLLLEEIKTAKSTSFDYYTFVRNAYFQRRNALVSDSAEATGTNGDTLYELDNE